MRLLFRESDHKYFSPEDPEIEWTGVTSLIKKFAQPFDEITQSVKASKNRKSKWYGLSPEEIRLKWKEVSNRAIDQGKWFHSKMEHNVLTDEFFVHTDGDQYRVSRPLYDGNEKVAPEQKLANNEMYPEHMVYNKNVGLVGQADLVYVKYNKINIEDYKTNAEIKMEGFRSYDGTTQKMTGILSHLDDCHFTHYALQLSLYMTLMLKCNFNLGAGSLLIKHIRFEESGRDQYGYAIPKYDDRGDPIVKEVVPIKLPYLKNETLNLLKYLKENKQSYNKAA